MMVRTVETPGQEVVAPPSMGELVPTASLAVDVVLFTVLRGPGGSPFRVLLVNQPDADGTQHWQLPGVLVRPSETFEGAARRAVAEKAGFDAREWYLEQLVTFGEPARDSRGRVASIAHVALVRTDEAIAPGQAGLQTEWCSVDRLAERVLAFDHAEMIRVGIQRIRNKLRYSCVAFQLLPGRFTLAELRAVYAVILDPSLARLSSGNFKKAMRPLFESGLLRVVGRSATGRRGRPSDLYSFVGQVTGTRERELPW
ncbi:MAG TPA: NUDIX domain-containing protein [Chloroflexota bacterium]|nr:NUDIX domain-containing protein [Chloroflexota bacterium]